MVKRYDVDGFPKFILFKNTVQIYTVEGADIDGLTESIRLNVDRNIDSDNSSSEDIDELIESVNSSSELINPQIEHNHSKPFNSLDYEEFKKLEDIFINSLMESSTQKITNTETTLSDDINVDDEKTEWTTQNYTSSQQLNCSNNSKFTKLTILLVILNMIFTI